jgi:hypothetical protein
MVSSCNTSSESFAGAHISLITKDRAPIHLPHSKRVERIPQAEFRLSARRRLIKNGSPLPTLKF